MLSEILFNPTVNRVIADLDNSASMSSVVARDAVDSAGRIYQANKRDANDGRERAIEEILTLVLWGFGIRWMKKYLYDPFMAKFSPVKLPGFDTAMLDAKHLQALTPKRIEQFVKEPVAKEHLLKLATNPGLQKLYKLNTIARFLIVTGVPTLLIAFGIPKFNQWLTRKKVAEYKQQQQPNPFMLRKPFAFRQFENNPPPVPAGIHFGGGLVNSLSSVLQNERTNTLLVDATISGGRTWAGRNMYERLETVLQEAATVFFLYFAQGFVQRCIEKTVDKNFKVATALDFQTIKALTGKYGKTPAKLFSDLAAVKNVVKLSDQKLVDAIQHYTANGKTGNLLFDVANLTGKGAAAVSKGKTVFDPIRKIDPGAIRNLGQQLESMAGKLDNKAGSLAPFLKKTMSAKFIGFIGAAAICSLFLGYLVPKAKQWMTYRLTGKNQFPGVMNA